MAKFMRAIRPNFGSSPEVGTIHPIGLSLEGVGRQRESTSGIGQVETGPVDLGAIDIQLGEAVKH
ncbi:MAG: hypothetical protein WCA10_11500, partial [Terracidiphilus sp.]